MSGESYLDFDDPDLEPIDPRWCPTALLRIVMQGDNGTLQTLWQVKPEQQGVASEWRDVPIYIIPDEEG